MKKLVGVLLLLLAATILLAADGPPTRPADVVKRFDYFSTGSDLCLYGAGDTLCNGIEYLEIKVIGDTITFTLHSTAYGVLDDSLVTTIKQNRREPDPNKVLSAADSVYTVYPGEAQGLSLRGSGIDTMDVVSGAADDAEIRVWRDPTWIPR